MAVKTTLKSNKGKSTHCGEFGAVFTAWHDEDGAASVDARFSGSADLAIMKVFGMGIGRTIKEIDAANRLHGQAVRDGIAKVLEAEEEGESGDD